MKTTLAALACAILAAQPAFAAWPDDKPIEVVIGFGIGVGGVGESVVVAGKGRQDRRHGQLARESQQVIVGQRGEVADLVAALGQGAQVGQADDLRCGVEALIAAAAQGRDGAVAPLPDA